jgi:hypothetical protein
MRKMGKSLFTEDLFSPEDVLRRCLQIEDRQTIVRAMFPQTFFCGRSKSPISGYIVVIENFTDSNFEVYFRGEKMYQVSNPNSIFSFDVNNHCMISTSNYRGQYEEKYG